MLDIARWDPMRELSAVRAEMERLLGRGAEDALLPRRWSPTADVVERDDEIVITAELPGVKDEDIEISVRDGILRIAGERRMEEEVREDTRYRMERTYGSFERSFALPPGVREDDITAGIAYGVLKVTIPKGAGREPRRIPVGAD